MLESILRIYYMIYGILNLAPVRSSSFAGNNNTPPQTNTKANKVPILVRSVTSVRLTNNAGTPTTIPVKMVEKDGVLYFG